VVPWAHARHPPSLFSTITRRLPRDARLDGRNSRPCGIGQVTWPTLTISPNPTPGGALAYSDAADYRAIFDRIQQASLLYT
jgi:hypothetical protein